MLLEEEGVWICLANTLGETESFGILFILKSTTEGPEGYLYCRKNTETHKKTKKQTNKRNNTFYTRTNKIRAASERKSIRGWLVIRE